MLDSAESAIWLERSAKLGELTTDAWWNAFTHPSGIRRAWGDHWQFTNAHLVYLYKIPYDPTTVLNLELIQWLKHNCARADYAIVIEYNVGQNGGRKRISHMNNIRGSDPRIAGVFFKDDTTLMLFKLTFGDCIDHDW